MFINFLCLCPLRVAIMLSFSISKVAYSERRYLGLVTRSIAGEHCVMRTSVVKVTRLLSKEQLTSFTISVITARVFSLTWPASMQIYWNKRNRLHKKSSTPAGLVWDTNMATVTSCENTLLSSVWYQIQISRG